MAFAIIGGTGLQAVAQFLEESRTEEIETRYGQTQVVRGQADALDVVFLPRHGIEYSSPPHLINYRANIQALKDLGIDNILAGSAVGSLRPDLKPGDFVVVDQFIDFTRGRAGTFVEAGGEIKYTDMSEPYDGRLRQYLARAAEDKGVRLHPGGTYICTEGPRFETPAEIAMFQKFDADVVGMTTVPEVVLANEAGMSYATLSVVTNYAAGIAGKRLTFEEVVAEMKKWDKTIFSIFLKAAEIGRL